MGLSVGSPIFLVLILTYMEILPETKPNMPSPEQPSLATDRIGKEPIGRLLLSFSIPAIIGMLVNALYNIVDRIYLGQGVDPLAIAGIGLVMPITMIIMASSMLIGRFLCQIYVHR